MKVRMFTFEKTGHVTIREVGVKDAKVLFDMQK